MKYTKVSSFLRAGFAAAAVMAAVGVANANPFASCITNNSGTISFYLNESNATVTVTYDDGSTNANFNGITTSTNTPAGITNFSLTGHTSYTITVVKNGSGTPSAIGASPAITNTRGIDANKIPTSPYFGHVYDVQANVGVWLLNADLSKIKTNAQTGGVGFPFSTASTTTASPDWVKVAPDGTVLVTDESFVGSAIYQMAPDFSTNNLFLGPVGTTNGETVGSHGTIISSAIVTGSTNAGNMVLYTVDGDLGNPGSIQVYKIGSGPLPWTHAPDYQGAQISISGYSAEALGGNEYIGFTMAPNGDIYGSTYRSSSGTANFVTITDSTGSNVLWSSEGLDSYPTTTPLPASGDWFLQPAAGNYGLTGGSAVSPDGKYLAAYANYDYVVVAPLTNGIPNTAQIFVIPPTTVASQSRGICWDAAGNLLLSTSGLGLVQSFTLGGSSTCVTTGNAAGTTGFTLTQPAVSVSVVAVTNAASQGGFNGTVGTPIAGAFSVYRYSTNGYATPLTVNFTLTGTATNGSAYTSSATNTVVIPAGQTNVLVYIKPTTNNVPRATTTAILSASGGAGYTVAAPTFDTVYITNTSSQQIVLAAQYASMYKAFSNDFASFTLTRLGDLSAASYTISSYNYSGTAVAGTDYTFPTNITFNPGDTIYTNAIMPLVAGAPPVDTTNPTYIGNLTAIIGLNSATGVYTNVSTNKVTLTSIDNATLPTTVLWSSPLTDPNEGTNWIITFGAGNIPADGTNGEYEVVFGYDLTSANPNYGFNGQANGIIGYPPSGATTCLRITCNKAANTAGNASGVNAFPITGTNFGGNYAVRFYMNLVQGANAADATEGALFGINHLTKGLSTNWFGAVTALPAGLTGWASDGVWYWVEGQGGGEGNGDFIQVNTSNVWPNLGYQSLTGVFGSSFAGNFKNPVPFNTDQAYNSVGTPANESPNASANANSTPANVWVDVEIKQLNNVITMSIDKIPIFSTNNTTIWTNGVPMLGYNDPFNSIQDEDGAAYFSDIRVVSLSAPTITSISAYATTNSPIKITFTSSDSDVTASSFSLLSNGTNSAANVDTVVSGVTFTNIGTGVFQAIFTKPTNTMQFYRIMQTK